MFEPLYFSLMGVLGALLYVLAWSKRWRDLVRFRSFVVGLVAGYVCHLFSDNIVMAVAIGWVSSLNLC